MPAQDTLFLVCAMLGYLAGSIPFGLIITRLAGQGDIRQTGSGNIGATNVLRTGKKGLAAATLLADALKGAAAVCLAREYGPQGAELIAGPAAFLGHIFPVWLNFKGGKGVATYLGILLALSPVYGLAFMTLWIAFAVIFRISSLSALAAGTAIPVGLAVFGAALNVSGGEIIMTAGMTLIIYYTHLANLKRLWSGEEPKIGV